jgi:hypothetical protein
MNAPTVDYARAFIASMEDEDQTWLKQAMETDELFSDGIRLERHCQHLSRKEESLILFKVPYLAETRAPQAEAVYRFGLFRPEDMAEAWKPAAGEAITSSVRTVVRLADETPALKESGWAHVADGREGHYLDVGEVICGQDPGTMLGKMDLRSVSPGSLCLRCSQRVSQANGSFPHRHRWMDASIFGDPASVCRCGAKRAKAAAEAGR